MTILTPVLLSGVLDGNASGTRSSEADTRSETLSGKSRETRWTMAGRAFPATGGPPPSSPGQGGAPRSWGPRDAPSRESGRRRPRPSPRSPGAPRLPLPPHPPAESREDAELGLWSGGHGPGHGPGGRLWAKFCVATEGGVEKAKPRLVGLLIGRHSTPGERAPSPSALTDPLNLPGPHCPRPLASAGDPAPPYPTPPLQPPLPANSSSPGPSPRTLPPSPGPHLRLGDPVPPQLHHSEVTLAQRALDVVEPHPDRPALQVLRAIRHDHAGPRC